MRKIALALATSAMTAMLPGMAIAQVSDSADGDVLIMRRTVSPPMVFGGPANPDGPGETVQPVYDWTYGEFGNWSSQCSLKAERFRNVSCKDISLNPAVTVDYALCDPADNEGESQIDEVIVGCNYEWLEGDWSPYDSTCSKTARKTRTVTCRRSDGETSLDSFCSGDGVKPVSELIEPNEVDCPDLLRNAGFENGITSWEYVSGSVYVTIVPDSKGGTKALSMNESRGIYQDLNLSSYSPGTYTVDGWCKGANAKLQIMMQTNGLNSSQTVTCNSTTYQNFQVSIPFNAPAGTKSYFRFRIDVFGGDGYGVKYAIIDDIKLTKN